MKSVVLIPIEPGKKGKDRRKRQRRLSVPRRLQSQRRNAGPRPSEERHKVSERRDSGDRRRLPDRRLGVQINLDQLDL